MNQDYREAARFIPQGKEPTLEFHAPGRRAVRGLRHTAQAQVRAVGGTSCEDGRPAAACGAAVDVTGRADVVESETHNDLERSLGARVLESIPDA